MASVENLNIIVLAVIISLLFCCVDASCDVSKTMANITKYLQKKELTLASYNVRGIMSTTPYLCEFLCNSKVDICAISEHWLFPDQLSFLNSIDPQFVGIGVCDKSLDPLSRHRRGKGGTALLWNKIIDTCVLPIQTNSDRIVGIEINLKDQRKLCILSVYLPASNHTFETFEESVNELFDLYWCYCSNYEVIIMGDLNCQINGDRCKPVPNDRTAFIECLLQKTDMLSLTVSATCDGPDYTFTPYSDNRRCTLIDHILVNQSLCISVVTAKVIGDTALNCSDHYPVIATVKTNLMCVLTTDLEMPSLN